MKKITISLILVGVLIASVAGVITYFLLRPSEPRFTVLQVDVYRLSVVLVPAGLPAEQPGNVSCFFQLRLRGRNPSRRPVVAHYGPLTVYAAVAGQEDQNITVGDHTFHEYQQAGKRSAVLVIAMAGIDRPLTTETWYQLSSDVIAGRVAVDFNGAGSVRWKIGLIFTPHRRFRIRCSVVLQYGGPERPYWSMQNANQDGDCDYSDE